MRYELSDFEWAAITDASEQTAWRASGERPARAQRHLLGPAVWRAVA
jgi:hypothetical protein